MPAPLLVAILLAAPLHPALAPVPAPVPAPVDPARLVARLTVGDPSIARVQAAAAALVEQAVPDPVALAARRRLAALLPVLTAELRADDRSYRTTGLTGSGEVDYFHAQPTSTVMARATWDLPDLVVTRGEPTAASAALARHRRREEAVRQATALYYERRRLLVTMAMDPPSLTLARAEAELELERVTADLDALTGGLFGGRGGP